jgi:hypothetical protein
MKTTATNSFHHQVGNNTNINSSASKNLLLKQPTSTVDEENASDTIIYQQHNNLVGSTPNGIRIPSFPNLKIDHSK